MFGRWRENKNTASITFKKYEQTPEDKYPTFSICLAVDKTTVATLYHEDKLQQILGTNSLKHPIELIGYLEGIKENLYNDSDSSLKWL